ncbi:glutamate synthase central domain-containing protein, partial [Klebsiella pneumoniae]
IVLESAEPREIHHFACLLGYGATVINPYLVYESIKDLINKGELKLDYQKAVANFIKASSAGIVKIASKMGVSTLQSYNGSALFECLGINSKIVEKYFSSTTSRIEGIDLEDIEKETLKIHNQAFKDKSKALDSLGIHGFRSEKEEHLIDPLAI